MFPLHNKSYYWLICFNIIPQHTDAFCPSRNGLKNHCIRNRALAFAAIHEQPFPLPHYCGTGEPAPKCGINGSNCIPSSVVREWRGACLSRNLSEVPFVPWRYFETHVKKGQVHHCARRMDCWRKVVRTGLQNELYLTLLLYLRYGAESFLRS
jgi:hypothetical protein